jgi:nicotinate-nucleotide adenylyltransferase
VREGYFGGTFDPIHAGHLDVARAAYRALGLDRLAFVPAHTPPHRAQPLASGAHRFAMVALALMGEDGFEVSDLDMLSSDPSYTTATLDRLALRGVDMRGDFTRRRRGEETQRDGDAEGDAVFFVTGADAFADIASWKDYPALLERCHFAVVSRPGRSVASLRETLPALTNRMIDVPPSGPCPVVLAPRILLIDAPTAPISSTEVRARAGGGQPLTGLVAGAVERHIITNRLYGRL